MWVERAAPFLSFFFSFHSLITIETIFVKTFLFFTSLCACACVHVHVWERAREGRGQYCTCMRCNYRYTTGLQSPSPYFFFFFFSHSTLTSLLKVKVWANQWRRPRRYVAFGSVGPRSVFVTLSEQTVQRSRGFHRLSTGPLLLPFVAAALLHFLFCSPRFLPLQFKRMYFLFPPQKKKIII